MTRVFAVFLSAFLFAGGAAAETRGGELSALANWIAKGQQKARIDGKVAKTLGLNQDGRPIDVVAVTTAYLDGSRIVHLVQGPSGEHILFSQGRATQGQWYLSNRSGALLRAIEWVPTSANPQPLNPANLRPAFTEMKAFWKAQISPTRR